MCECVHMCECVSERERGQFCLNKQTKKIERDNCATIKESSNNFVILWTVKEKMRVQECVDVCV